MNWLINILTYLRIVPKPAPPAPAPTGLPGYIDFERKPSGKVYITDPTGGLQIIDASGISIRWSDNDHLLYLTKEIKNGIQHPFWGFPAEAINGRPSDDITEIMEWLEQNYLYDPLWDIYEYYNSPTPQPPVNLP